MNSKDYRIKQAQALISEYDKNMDWQSKVLREQALAFIARYSSIDTLALTLADSLKPEGAQTK